MAENQTVLIQKHTRKGKGVDNYKSIGCLNLLWKLLTDIINKNFYDHLNQQNILSEERKGCRQKARETKNQSLIDNVVVRNSRRRKTNLNVAWVDFRKAYDLVPCSWILKTLELVGTATNIIELLKRNMLSWKTVLLSEKDKLRKVKMGYISRSLYIAIVICGCCSSCYNNLILR